MKRPISAEDEGGETAGVGDSNPAKKSKLEANGSAKKAAKEAEAVLLDENLLFEVLKHVDARTLAWAACVSQQWNRTAQDERLWEIMCIKDGSRNYQQRQFRTVVTALGGFRQLYSLHLWPLVKLSSQPAEAAAASSSPAPCFAWHSLPAPPVSAPAKSVPRNTRLGKDEMNLSLSLFSIQFYAKMNSSNRNKGT